MSQAALAKEMTTRGFRWHQATVYKVENGDRQIQLGEARAVARIFNLPLDDLLSATDEAGRPGADVGTDDEFRYYFRTLRDGAQDSVAVLQEIQRGTFNRLEALQDFPFAQSKEVRDLVQSASDSISNAMDKLFAVSQLPLPVRTAEERRFWGDKGMSITRWHSADEHHDDNGAET